MMKRSHTPQTQNIFKMKKHLENMFFLFLFHNYLITHHTTPHFFLLLFFLYSSPTPVAHATPHAQRYVLVSTRSCAVDVATVVHVPALLGFRAEHLAEDAWDCALLALGVELFQAGTAPVAHTTPHTQRDVLVPTRPCAVDVTAVVHVPTRGRVCVEKLAKMLWDGPLLAFGVKLRHLFLLLHENKRLLDNYIIVFLTSCWVMKISFDHGCSENHRHVHYICGVWMVLL